MTRRIINPSDDDNEETDDPEYWEDGELIAACPWCGGDGSCRHLDDDGNPICAITRKFIP
jgi:hypothetical protein